MSDTGDLRRVSNESITIHGDKMESSQLGDSIGTTIDPTAHVLDIKELGFEGQGLQTAHDGKTVLIPQPTSDPNDPLNWSPLKKHIILFVITVVAFLPDFGSSMGAVTLLPQAVLVASGEIYRRAC